MSTYAVGDSSQVCASLRKNQRLFEEFDRAFGGQQLCFIAP